MNDPAIEQVKKDMQELFGVDSHVPYEARASLCMAIAIARQGKPQDNFSLNELMRTRTHLFRLNNAVRSFLKAPTDKEARGELDQILQEIANSY